MIFVRFKMAWYSSGPQFLSSQMQHLTTNSRIKLGTSSVIPATQSNNDWGTERLVSPFLQRTSSSRVQSGRSTVRRHLVCPMSPALNNRKKPKVQIWTQKRQQISVAGTSNRLSVAARHCHFAKHACPYQTFKLTSLAMTKSSTIKFRTHQCCFQCGLLLYVLRSIGTRQLKELDNGPVLWAGQNSVIQNCWNSLAIQFTADALYDGYCFCGNVIAHAFDKTKKIAPCLDQLEFCFALRLRLHSQARHAIHGGLLLQIPLGSLLGLSYLASNNILI